MKRVGVIMLVGMMVACTSANEPASEPGAVAKQEAQPEVRVEGSPEPSPESSKPDSIAPVDGFFMAQGAPQPRACKVASDCVGDTIPDLDQPCCQNPRTLEPHARAYKQWIVGWRAEHCAELTCPPPPAPSLPPDCAFEVDCVEGGCVDSCP